MDKLASETIREAYDFLNEQARINPGNLEIEMPDKKLHFKSSLITMGIPPEHPFTSLNLVLQKTGPFYLAITYLTAQEKGMFFDCSNDYSALLRKRNARFSRVTSQIIGGIFDEESKNDPRFLISANGDDLVRTIVPNYWNPNLKPVIDFETFRALVSDITNYTADLVSIVTEKHKDTPRKIIERGPIEFIPLSFLPDVPLTEEA